PHIVADLMGMTEEFLLKLCERNLMPRLICTLVEQRVIDRFGKEDRNLKIDPDKDPKPKLRPDDAPLVESFKRFYNRLESWVIFIKTNPQELNDEFKQFD